MSIKNNKRSARVSSKKVTISNQAKGLTSQAWLEPVVKFLRKCGMIGLIKETVDHERSANALYDSVDAVFLSVIATIGGVRALSSVTTVWSRLCIKEGWQVGFPFLTTAFLAVCFGHLESVKFLNVRL